MASVILSDYGEDTRPLAASGYDWPEQTMIVRDETTSSWLSRGARDR